MSDAVRIYIDALPIDAEPGSQLIDAIALSSPGDAEQVRSGKRVITDSRGLPAAPDSEVFAGAIYRLVHARTAGLSQQTD